MYLKLEFWYEYVPSGNPGTVLPSQILILTAMKRQQKYMFENTFFYQDLVSI
jgi:hypothetical protein